eukprot:Sspe_Gene.119842::Locus_116914_Transcript_1_1_Confidence_1.000_Length_470::g.119842::m.119842
MPLSRAALRELAAVLGRRLPAQNSLLSYDLSCPSPSAMPSRLDERVGREFLDLYLETWGKASEVKMGGRISLQYAENVRSEGGIEVATKAVADRLREGETVEHLIGRTFHEHGISATAETLHAVGHALSERTTGTG